MHYEKDDYFIDEVRLAAEHMLSEVSNAISARAVELGGNLGKVKTRQIDAICDLSLGDAVVHGENFRKGQITIRSKYGRDTIVRTDNEGHIDRTILGDPKDLTGIPKLLTAAVKLKNIFLNEPVPPDSLVETMLVNSSSGAIFISPWPEFEFVNTVSALPLRGAYDEKGDNDVLATVVDWVSLLMGRAANTNIRTAVIKAMTIMDICAEAADACIKMCNVTVSSKTIGYPAYLAILLLLLDTDQLELLACRCAFICKKNGLKGEARTLYNIMMD